MSTTRDAFISYSQRADLRIAQALERGLQRLARPWNRLRAMSIFRDASDLSLSSHLWPSIQSQLDGSRFLIVLACPESAASVWVNREIEYFCETKGTESIILVLTGGELVWDEDRKNFTTTSTAVPPALAGRLADQPLWLDLRWARDAPDLSLRLSQFRYSVAQLASPIRNLSPEDIESEDVRQHRRALRLARGAVAALFVLGVVASIAAVVAVGNAHRAARRAREATGGQLGLDALDLPPSEIGRALLLSVAAGQLAPQSDQAAFRASRVLIGRYSKLTALHDAGAAYEKLSVQALALTNDGTAVVGLATGGGMPELLRWDLRQRGEPTATPLPSGLGARLAPIGPGDAVVVGEPPGPVSLFAGGQLTALPGAVSSLDVAGGRAVVRAENGTQRLVDVLSGRVIAELDQGTVELAGDRVALVTDGAVHLLDSATGAELAAGVVERGLEIGAMEFSADQGALVVVTTTGRVLRFELVGTSFVNTSAVEAPAAVGSVRDLLVSADGTHTLLVGSSGSAVVDLASGDLLGLGSGETGTVAADPSGRYGAVAGKHLVVWDLRSGDRVFAAAELANALAWSGPCDDGGRCRLVTAGATLDAWDPATGRRTRMADQTNAEAVAISTDASVVVSAGWGSALAQWSLTPTVDDSGREQLAGPGSAASVDPYTLKIARATSATTIEITSDGGAVSVDTGAFDRFVLLPNGGRLATTSAGRVRLFDAADGSTIVTDPACVGDLLAVSSSGDKVVAFRSDQLIAAVCDAESGSLVAQGRLPAGSLPPSAIAVDDDGSVAIGDGAGFVTVLAHAADGGRSFAPRASRIDARSGKESAEVRSLSMLHGVVAAGLRARAVRGAQASVLVWPIGGTPVQFVIDFLDIPAVALVGDADAVVVAGRDALGAPILQTWETATRRRLGRAFSGLTGDVVALGGDGTSVVGADASGAVYRWRQGVTATDEICKIVGRPLRRDEWDDALGGALRRYAFSPVCSAG